MRKIGVLGGTFNPIHIGHLMLAECAREELSLDEVWFIPTGCSYMKEEQLKHAKGMPLPSERLEMTRVALEGIPYFRCLDIEVQREGNTYSYETLEELKAANPADKFYFLFGADCLYTIESWKHPERIFAVCDIAAAVRGDISPDAMKEKCAQLKKVYGARIELLRFRNLEISSTEIRERVKDGKSIRYMTPEGVIAYIREKGFYGE